MTNKELLERCAKVMGYELLPQDGSKPPLRRVRVEFTDGTFTWGSMLWNPLTSVADAADMAVKMKVDVVWIDDGRGNRRGVRADHTVITSYGKPTHIHERRALFKDHPTEQAAYCYAVCSVVAQMGGE